MTTALGGKGELRTIRIADKHGRQVIELNLKADPRLRFRFTNPDGTAAEPDAEGSAVVRALGVGGFGVVVRAEDALGLHRAVKILKPGHASRFDYWQEEIRANQRIPKKHTAPIIAWGSAKTTDGHDAWYYVMPYLHGFDLDEFFNGLFDHHRPNEKSPPEVIRGLYGIALRVWRDVLLALEELEYEQLAHMDVLPWNVRVVLPSREKAAEALHSMQAELKVFLIDLGVARRYGDDAGLAKLPLRRNANFFPNWLVAEFCTDVGGELHVNPQRLAACGSRVDLCLFGRMLDFLLKGSNAPPMPGQSLALASELRREQWAIVLGAQHEFIREVAARLQDPTTRWFQSAANLRELFDGLITPQNGVGYDSLILNDQGPGTHFRVPDVLVHVAYPLNRVVNHPVFQRLRNLKQLAFIDQVYPGGVHTRFVHSLQVFDLMKRYIGSLSGDDEFRIAFQRPQVDSLLTAALIHDVGHFPFAHTIEDLRKLGDLSHDLIQNDEESTDVVKEARDALIQPLREISHDHELTAKLLDWESPDWSTGEHRTLRALLVSHGIDVEAACYMLAKSEQTDTARPFERIGRELVAGLIDADRLCYLRLDSRETGVKFGLAVDVDSIIENLRIRPANPIDKIGLGIDEIAIPAVEAVLAGVYWMYQNVYWHPRNRAFMAAVKRAFQRLLLNRAFSFEEYWKATIFLSDDSALRYLVDRYETWLAASDIPEKTRFNPLKPLTSGLRLQLDVVWELGQSRRDPRPHRGIARDENEVSLYDKLVTHLTPWTEEALLRSLALELFKDAGLAEQIFIDLPLKPRLRNDATAPSERTEEEAVAARETVAELHNKKTQLWVYGRDPDSMERGQWLRLGQRSSFAALLWTLEDIEARKIRVYTSRTLSKMITDDGEFRRSVTRVISTFFGIEQPDMSSP